jgi:hypothetical protein
MSIGINVLTASILNSKILTENNISQLAAVPEIPVIDPSYDDERLKSIFQYYSVNPEEMEKELHLYAKELLDAGKVEAAWQVLLSTD